MPWSYPSHQYEIGLLHEVVRAGFAANRYVHYAGNYADCASEAEFRVGAEVVRVVAEPGQPPALWTERPDAVLARVPGGGWEPTRTVEGRPELPPHREPEPLVDVALTVVDGLWCSERPVLGRPVFACAGVPVVMSGESRAEALSDPATAETRHDLVRLPDGRWTTEHALGFRYLRIEGEVEEVVVRAYERPTPRRGSFACSDPTLTRIWQVSADTLHACRHGLMIDGIKRDRMPWIGDQALNTLANAYAFGDRDIVTSSLVALGRPKDGYVNGIADYSLWWLIGTGFLARHFDAASYLAAEADHIDAFTARLAAHRRRSPRSPSAPRRSPRPSRRPRPRSRPGRRATWAQQGTSRSGRWSPHGHPTRPPVAGACPVVGGSWAGQWVGVEVFGWAGRKAACPEMSGISGGAEGAEIEIPKIAGIRSC